MALISIVKLSELEGAKRTDAEYYQPQHIDLVSRMKEHRTCTLRSMGCEVVSGPFGSSLKSEAYLSEGVPFIRIQNLLDFFIDKQDLVYISVQDNERLRNSQLKAGDLVLSKVGNTIGVVSIVTEDIGNCNISENNIGIRFTRGIQAPVKSYVLTYLNSKLGRQQILRRISGNAQPKLNVRDISEMLINVPSERLLTNVDGLIRHSKVLIDLTASLYSQAENLLLEELELKDFQPKYELSYTASLSKAFGVHRVDAEYFQPLYEDLMKVVAEKCSLIPLGMVFNFTRGIFIPTDYYTDEKTNRPYIRIKELSGRIGIEESKVVFIKDSYPQDKNNELKENDLVVAIIGDTIGKTNRISMELAGGFCSNNMGRLRIKSDWANRILPEFAELAFQSLFVQRQVEQGKAQTGQPKISDFEIRVIKVPMPAIETQKEIASLIQQSHGARRKAKELLEEAKSKVENLIEGKA